MFPRQSALEVENRLSQGKMQQSHLRQHNIPGRFPGESPL